jgi:hypothetical protein
MIGKAKWFRRRKYGGWGLFPNTWQGWAYIGALILSMAVIQYLPLGDTQTKVIISLVVVGLFVLDTIDIMIHLPMDERDRLHEAKAERNALWVMLAVLIVGVGYQSATSVVSKTSEVDPVIIIAIIGAVIAKAITNIYLDRKN